MCIGIYDIQLIIFFFLKKRNYFLLKKLINFHFFLFNSIFIPLYTSSIIFLLINFFI